jgi:hypothetical protein
MVSASDSIIDLYERRANDWVSDRSARERSSRKDGSTVFAL